MRIVPHNEKQFGVKDATAHNHILKDRFGAIFKKGKVFAWLVDMDFLEEMLAEFPGTKYSETEFAPDWQAIDELRTARKLERATNLMKSLYAGGFVIIDTGDKLRLWGPEEDGNSAVRNMPDLERRLNELADFILIAVDMPASVEEDAAHDEPTTFVPRGVSAELADVHWKVLKS